MQIGVVEQLWRYPVKSLQGEHLTHARITPQGIPGDRGIALVDPETGHVLSGKRVEQLLTARALARPGGAAIVLPDGRTVHTSSPDASDLLSGWLGRPVRVATTANEDAPTIDSEEGGVFRGYAGSFFDGAPLHLLTTSTLAHLSALYPEGVFDPRRFRANIVVRTDGDGPVERSWVGRTVTIGDARFEVLRECTRCIMTTSAQADLPRDRGILRTVAREQDNVVGVKGQAVVPGEVQVGAPVVLE